MNTGSFNGVQMRLSPALTELFHLEQERDSDDQETLGLLRFSSKVGSMLCPGTRPEAHVRYLATGTLTNSTQVPSGREK